MKKHRRRSRKTKFWNVSALFLICTRVTTSPHSGEMICMNTKRTFKLCSHKRNNLCTLKFLCIFTYSTSIVPIPFNFDNKTGCNRIVMWCFFRWFKFIHSLFYVDCIFLYQFLLFLYQFLLFTSTPKSGVLVIWSIPL